MKGLKYFVLIIIVRNVGKYLVVSSDMYHRWHSTLLYVALISNHQVCRVSLQGLPERHGSYQSSLCCCLSFKCGLPG